MGLLKFIKKQVKKHENVSFSSYVLLDEAEWDREQFVKDLLDEWEIDVTSEPSEPSPSNSPELSESEDDRNIIHTKLNDMALTIRFVDEPAPEDDVEYYARANFMWRQAVPVAQTQIAYILIEAAGTGDRINDLAKLQVKVATSGLRQAHAIAAYTEGAFYEPEFYRSFAHLMLDEDDAIPLMNLVWFGLYFDKKNAEVYTNGMRKFGKDEIEVYAVREDVDMNELREFITSISAYILENDITLRDGNSIGFTETQKLHVKKSKGVAIGGHTIKIHYHS